MKLLQILYPGLGGTSTVAFSLIDDLKKKNNSSINNFFIFYGVERLTKNNLQNCKKKKINFFFFLKSNFLIDTYRVYLKIKSIKPDYIITHSNSFFSLFLIKLLHKKNFYCVDHTPDEVRSFKEWVNLFLFTIFSSGMIYVSERNKNNKIFSVLKFFNSKFKIIRNGIDTNKFKRKKKILQKKKIIIGMAARFVKEKKQSLIIDTFINNKQYFCEKNIALSFAGSGDLLNSQKKKVQENNLSSFIKFKGNLNEKNLIKWFNEIDIYFHLSDAETTSTAILQALSNSLPIYASKVQGNIQISKFIGKKYIKLITNDKKSLKNAIMSLINNRNYFINISKLMKKNVNNKISLNNISKKYLDFITS